MISNRNIEFDVLRTLIIFSALVLHYHTNFDIGFLVAPSWFIQNYFVTVGGFFFFTAGYMAKKVYLKKFIDRPWHVSKKLIYKGLGILTLYVIYVFVMHIFTETKLPDNITAYIFNHRFYTKVLFTFSLLFMLSPIVLYIYTQFPKLLEIIIVAFVIGLFIDNSSMPIIVRKMIIDRNSFLYPLVPSLLVYFGGFYFAKIDPYIKLESLKITCIVVTIILVQFFSILFIDVYEKTISNRNIFIVCEIAFSIFFLLLTRYLLSIKHIAKIISSPFLLCIGILSLHFYVISNLIQGLLSITKDSELTIKIIGLVGVAVIAYIFTFWRFQYHVNDSRFHSNEIG